jgi:hypothetical protein
MAMPLSPGLGVNDILLGRGTGPNANQGNVRFRKLLEEMIVEKLQDPSRSMVSKTAVAMEVLQTIKERKGRFVRKLTSEERRYVLGTRSGKNKEGKNKDIFVVVADKLALEKIRHSIRFQLNNNKLNHCRSIFARGNETLGGGGQPRTTLRDTAIDLTSEIMGEDLVLLPSLLPPMATSYYHHHLLNAASRQNNIAMIPRDLQLSLLLQSLQRRTPVLPFTTPQPSPTLPAGDALNGVLLEFLISRTTDENILSLRRHIAAGRLNEIEKTLSLFR